MSGKKTPRPGESARHQATPHTGGFGSTLVAIASPLVYVGSRALLTITSGSDAGRVLPIGANAVVTLGRADECTFRLNDISLSRVHARVVREGDQYVLFDQGSTNGSVVNGTRITAPVVLRDGDRVLLGTSTSLRFTLVSDEEEAALLRAYDASTRDGLTGVFNRKHFDERLDSELAFALRHDTPLTLVMVDVDYFKRVNDTYGHLGGDAVLRHIAELLGAAVRAEDLVSRFGGEEFAIVARGIDLVGGIALAERLRFAIAQSPTPFGPLSISVTGSFGVATLTCCGARRDKTELVTLADSRLYQAKQAGRDRVIGALP